MRALMPSLLASALLVLVAWGPGPLAGEKAAEVAPVQDEVTARIKRLEDRVAKLESEKATLDLDVEAHKSLLKSIFSWMASLPKAADDLAGGMDEARKLGFEAAGANPQAKTELIESLKGFAQAINAGNPAVKKKSD
ncbi:MAG: hypothetical protein H6807_02595 [Planctomycetes bacterium]|nr:hypothetical protein [Planctomycetota bacterium]